MKHLKVLFVFAVFAAALVCVLMPAGCGSAPKTAGKGDDSPLDPRLIGTWLWGGTEGMNELVYSSDNNISLHFLSADGKPEEVYPLPYRDNGYTVGVAGKKTTVTLEKGGLLWAGTWEAPLPLTRARDIDSCVGKWSVVADDGSSMSYTFAKDGTYKHEFAGNWGSGVSEVLGLAGKGGIDGAGTWAVSGHRVLLTPKGGFYVALISGPGEAELRKSAKYPLIYVDGKLWLDGLLFTKTR